MSPKPESEVKRAVTKWAAEYHKGELRMQRAIDRLGKPKQEDPRRDKLSILALRSGDGQR